MVYKVVFDSTSSNAWWLLLNALPLFLALLLLIVAGIVLWVSWRGGWRFRLFGVGLFLVLTLSFIWDISFSHHFYFGLYRHSGAYQMVEGRVERYRSFSAGHTNFEQFQVGGVNFGYGSSGLGKCFHKTAANRGPMHEGLPVRVSYDVSCIVKLEIAPEQNKM